VLLNFLSNAIKFTKPGGRIKVVLQHLKKATSNALKDQAAEFFQSDSFSSNLDLSPREESDTLALAVLDSGVGIAEEDQAKLFKLFGCLQSTKTLNTKGIGLGLAISKMISEEYGGGVAVKSKLGVGSAFYSTMEINKQAATNVQTAEASQLASTLSFILKKQQEEAKQNEQEMNETGLEIAHDKRVLVVDDEAYNC